MIKLVQRDLLSCEAIVRRTPNKELLMVAQCGDITEPAPLNRVYVWHSKDDGNTWSARELIMPENGKAVYQTEVSIINDEIFVFITMHDGGFNDFDCKILKSKDNGYTWVDSGKVPFLDGFVFMRGVLEYKEKLLFPYQHYMVSDVETKVLSKYKKKIWDSSVTVVENGVLFADKNGVITGRSNNLNIPLYIDSKKRWVWSEPTLAKLSNDDIVMLMRVDGSGYLHESISKDGGNTWSEMIKTDIPNPSNKPKLINLKDGRIALLNTPNSSQGMINRNPLEIWISDDDMKTWKYKKTLVDFPGWISYPDGFIEGDMLYLSFEFNRHDVYFLKTKLD